MTFDIHNTQGGFLITNIIVQIAYESSLLYVLDNYAVLQLNSRSGVV